MLAPSDVALTGRWQYLGDKVVADETCMRIECLVNEHLQLIAHSPDGWCTLYRDPSDGRLWERSYPQGHLQGGGPPALHCVSVSDARARYPNAV
jgi:Immunity protein 27